MSINASHTHTHTHTPQYSFVHFFHSNKQPPFAEPMTAKLTKLQTSLIKFQNIQTNVRCQKRLDSLPSLKQAVQKKKVVVCMHCVLYLVKGGQVKHLWFLVNLTSLLIIVILLAGFVPQCFENWTCFRLQGLIWKRDHTLVGHFSKLVSITPFSNREHRAFVKRMIKVGHY